jgi:hypothetical protein
MKYLSCDLCQPEQASLGCVCCSSVLLVCSQCLTHHIKTCPSTHLIITLSLALQLSHSPLALKSFSSSATSKPFKCLNSISSSLYLSPEITNSQYRVESLSFDVERSLGLGDRYLHYFTSPYTLLIYDIPSQSLDSLNLGELEERNMYALTNGNLFLMCVSDDEDEEEEEEEETMSCYIVEVATKRFHKLPFRSQARMHIGFVCHGDYLYAFGGTDDVTEFNTAERFNLAKNTREAIPDMDYARSELSCVAIWDKIFLFHGSFKNIEVFNTLTLSYEKFTFENAEEKHSHGLAHRGGERVYLLTYSYIQIYDLQIRKLAQISLKTPVDVYSPYRVSTYKNEIYYFNILSGMVQRFPLSEISDIEMTESQPDDRYIYTPSEFLGLIRIDLQTKQATKLHFNYKTAKPDNLCVLPSGEIMVAIKKSSETLLYDPEGNTVKETYELPRKCVSLKMVYLRGSVYGFALEAAEKKNSGMKGYVLRLDAENRSWQALLEIKNAKKWEKSLCVGIEGRIYLIDERGGKDVYDIDSCIYANTYIVMDINYTVVKVVRDRIYNICGNRYMIYDTKLELIEQGTLNWPEHIEKTKSTVGVYGDRIYYYNDGTGLLESHDTISNYRSAEVIQIL